MKPVLIATLIILSVYSKSSGQNHFNEKKIQETYKDSIIYETLKQDLLKQDSISSDAREYLKTADELANEKMFNEATDFVLTAMDLNSQEKNPQSIEKPEKESVESIWRFDLSAQYYNYKYDSSIYLIDTSEISGEDVSTNEFYGTAGLSYTYRGGDHSIIKKVSPQITLSNQSLEAELASRLHFMQNRLCIQTEVFGEKRIKDEHKDSLDNTGAELDITLSSPKLLETGNLFFEIQEEWTHYKHNTVSYNSLSQTSGRTGINLESTDRDKGLEIFMAAEYTDYYGITPKDSIYDSYTQEYDRIGIGPGLYMMYFSSLMTITLDCKILKEYSIDTDDPKYQYNNDANLYIAFNNYPFSASLTSYLLYEKEIMEDVEKEVIDSVYITPFTSDTFSTYDTANVSYSLKGWNINLNPGLGLNLSRNIKTTIHCRTEFFNYPSVNNVQGHTFAFKDYIMESMYTIEPGITLGITPSSFSLSISSDMEREKITDLIYEDLQDEITYTFSAGIDIYWRINNHLFLTLQSEYSGVLFPEDNNEKSLDVSFSTGISF